MMVETASDSDPDFEFESSQSSPEQPSDRPNNNAGLQSSRLEASSQLTPFEISSPLQYQTGPTSLAQYESLEEPSSSFFPLAADDTASFQIPLHLTNKSFATESSYFTRPNRYFGPAATWRSWTEKERAVATAVDRERAMNLSRHLYNSYVLKRKATNANLAEQGNVNKDRGRQRSRKGKEPESDAEGDQNHAETAQEVTLFKPPRVWTAWPLPPAEVPREDSLLEVHLGGYRRAKDLRPSAMLEDCLLAMTTRFARERWRSREQEDASAPKLDEMVAPKERLVKNESGSCVTTSSDDQERSQSLESGEDHASGTMLSDVQQAQDDSSSADEDFPSEPGVQVFSSQMYGSPSSSVPPSVDLDPDLTPEFTIDDDQIRRLVLPSTRHIISRLDAILLAVHRSRQLYAYGNDRERSRTTSQSANRTQGDADSFSSGSAVRPQRATSNSGLPGIDDRSTSHSQPRSQSHSRSGPLNLHDWSSVIGLASIIQAFEPSTIARASERCARLFGENMLFRTFHEGESNTEPTTSKTTTGGVTQDETSTSPWFEEDFIIEDEEMEGVEDDTDQENEMVTDDKISALTQRTSKPCTDCKSAKTRCEPSLPAERDHQSMHQVRCARCIQLGLECSLIDVTVIDPPPIRGAGWHCPHEHCERHSIPFRKRSNLRRHITLSHAGEEVAGLLSSRDVSRKRSFSSMQETAPPTTEEIPYFCPVATCPRSRHGSEVPFKIGSRLYAHLRRYHPEVKVDIVKQLELQKRGERRGRWSDKRRHRSRSQPGRSTDRTDLDLG